MEHVVVLAALRTDGHEAGDGDLDNDDGENYYHEAGDGDHDNDDEYGAVVGWCWLFMLVSWPDWCRSFQCVPWPGWFWIVMCVSRPVWSHPGDGGDCWNPACESDDHIVIAIGLV